MCTICTTSVHRSHLITVCSIWCFNYVLYIMCWDNINKICDKAREKLDRKLWVRRSAVLYSPSIFKKDLSLQCNSLADNFLKWYDLKKENVGKNEALVFKINFQKIPFCVRLAWTLLVRIIIIIMLLKSWQFIHRKRLIRLYYYNELTLFFQYLNWY